MAASVAADHAFVRHELDPDAGRAWFSEHGQPFKVEILADLAAAAMAAGQPMPPVSTYEHGPFTDLCRGPHVASTGAIGPFKLLSVAGAYWRGDAARPMLQRIYGTVWATQEELDRYLWRRAEAKKRDHRRLGAQLDLFSFHDVAPGAAFWHPKGWTLYQTLRAAMRELQAKRGYQEVYTPPLVHQKLWERSGHWEHYRDNMFLVEAEGQTFSLKPMNCPESHLHLSQSDAVVSRLAAAPVRVRHPPSHRALGRPVGADPRAAFRDRRCPHLPAAGADRRRDRSSDGRDPRVVRLVRPDADADLRHASRRRRWAIRSSGRRPRSIMRQELARSGLRYREKPKDGAFYAPKIDIQIEDALGREWQTATIQVDRVMLPERFDLWYVDEEGQQQRPVAIHRAIYGSLERFIGVLVEHFAGAFPFWCAPVQAVVVPIADRHVEAGQELATVLQATGIRVEVDDSSNRMQNKIRLAQEQKVPYMLVLGDREVEARSAAPRTRAGEQQPAETWEVLADRLAAEAADRRP